MKKFVLLFVCMFTFVVGCTPVERSSGIVLNVAMQGTVAQVEKLGNGGLTGVFVKPLDSEKWRIFAITTEVIVIGDKVQLDEISLPVGTHPVDRVFVARKIE